MTERQEQAAAGSFAGLRVALGDAGPAVRTRRVGPNQWLLSVGEVDLGRSPLHGTEPGEVAAALARADAPALVARVELDACGAWATLACTADLRPFVVRRAGWVDERGDAVEDRRAAWPEDRVGLGPGDALAVVGERSASDGVPLSAHPADPRALRLLEAVGASADELQAAVGAAAVVQVPVDVVDAGPAWVAEATGVPASELVLPGYPLGDAAHPERWTRPPAPPRRSVFLLRRDLTRVRELRSVLNRLIRSWRLTGRVDEDVLVLLTSELASNALVHTRTDAAAVVSYLGATVRVSVVDGSPDAPRQRSAAADDLGGRGLGLLAAASLRWGTGELPTGKEVWFELPLT